MYIMEKISFKKSQTGIIKQSQPPVWIGHLEKACMSVLQMVSWVNICTWQKDDLMKKHASR